MSTVAADAAPAPKGKKKLFLIVGIALAVLLAGGGGALVLMKKSSADAEAEAELDEDGGSAPVKKSKTAAAPTGAPPVFVPLEPFTVNLADSAADRYAQVAVTLQIDDAKLEAELKAYLPAIRNNILLALADHTAAQLLGRDGKRLLAERIRRETARAMGYELPTEEELAEAEAEADAEGDDPPPKRRGKQRRAPEMPELPIRAVHFANFIIQ
jgi:flagellar protein FliL